MTDFDPTRQNETATSATDSSTRSADGRNFGSDAKSEASGMLRDGMKHPSTKPVLTGAAVGAVAGALLPFVSLPIGAVAGAGYMFYRRLRPSRP